jgi:hypothetical protein
LRVLAGMVAASLSVAALKGGSKLQINLIG